MGYIRRHITFANVVSLLALSIALGGTATAAISLSKNSVKSRNIAKGAVKNSDIGRNAVTSPKVKNGSLLAADFKKGQLPAGATGPRGLQGIQGVPGPSETFFAENFADTSLPAAGPDLEPIVRLQVPAGDYVLSASLRTSNSIMGSSVCNFDRVDVGQGPPSFFTGIANISGQDSQNVTVPGIAKMASAGTIGLYCATLSGTATQNDVLFTATKVGSATLQNPGN